MQRHTEHDWAPWSFYVFERVIRGVDGRRAIVLQLILWVLIGHFMAIGVIVFGAAVGFFTILEAASV